MTRIYRFHLIVAFLAVAPQLPAVEQQIEVAPGSFAQIELVPDANSVFDRFQSAFTQRAETTFTDQFQTLEVAWREITAENAAPDVFSVQSFGSASHALSKSIVYGLHAATLNLPLMVWLEGDKGFLANFVRDSVESVEADSGIDQESTARFSGENWWTQQLKTGALAYGIRPFRTDPYAFLSWGLRQGSDLVLATHVRYYCRNLFDHKFEFCFSVPLARQFSFDFGASYQFGRHDDQRELDLRFSRALPGGRLLHIGLQFRPHPELFAGVSIPI